MFAEKIATFKPINRCINNVTNDARDNWLFLRLVGFLYRVLTAYSIMCRNNNIIFAICNTCLNKHSS